MVKHSESKQEQDAVTKSQTENLSWSRPLAALLTAHAITITVVFGFICVEHDAVPSAMNLAEYEWIGYTILAYLSVLIGSRLWLTGPKEFYQQLWACNIAMALAVTGMLFHRRLLVGVACAIVLPDQPLWYGDCLSKMITGKFKLGVARYLDWPETPFIQKLTAWHHLWFLPLCAFYLTRTGGVPEGTLFWSWLAVYAMTALCRLLTPPDLNVNMSFGVWKDVKAPALHVADDFAGMFYVPLFCTVINCYMTVVWAGFCLLV